MNFAAFAIAAILTWIPGVMTAQFIRTTTVGACIVEGLTITESAPLHFGSMSIPTAPVDVVLTTTNSRISSSPSDISLMSQTPNAENATYTVAGSEGAAYSITLPRNGAVKISSGSGQMDVVDFKARPVSTGTDGLTGLLSSQGVDTFTIGATLKVGNAQPSGIYAGTFGISVNYN